MVVPITNIRAINPKHPDLLISGLCVVVAFISIFVMGLPTSSPL